MKKAVILGASGLVGSFLLKELLDHPAYQQVTIVVRKPVDITHAKLKTLIGDFHTLPGLKEAIAADEIFITLGTTQKKTPDRLEYYRIDHDYPVLGAQIAKENGAKSVFLLTAVGANPDSGLFYIKTKGEVERDVTALGFEHTHIFRPSMILGNRQESRPLEKALTSIWPVVNAILRGPLNRYKGITAKDIARAMVAAAQNPSSNVTIYHWSDMNALL